MGNSILKGISAALLVTVITLLGGMAWNAMGLKGPTMSTLVDIGLIMSCAAAGFRAGKDSGQWVIGGLASLGYVVLCIVLLALFLEVSSWGVIQVLAEGGLIGILSGALGAGGTRSTGGQRKSAGSWRSAQRFSSWQDSYYRDDYSDDYQKTPHEEWDSHSNDWSDLDSDPHQEEGYDWNKNEAGGLKNETEEEKSWISSEWIPRRKSKNSHNSSTKTKDLQEDEKWEEWLQEEKKGSRSAGSVPTPAYHKAWWEEDVL